MRSVLALRFLLFRKPPGLLLALAVLRAAAGLPKAVRGLTGSAAVHQRKPLELQPPSSSSVEEVRQLAEEETVMSGGRLGLYSLWRPEL